MTRREHGYLAMVLGIGLIVQVVYVLLLADSYGGGGWDSLEYSRHARSLLGAGIYSNDGVMPDRMRQPLYPLFLAAVYWLSGDGNPAVYAVQALVNTGSIGLTWWLGRRLGAGQWGALTGALVLALYPPFARLGGMILTESLSTLFWLVTAGLFVRCVVRPDSWGVLGLGAVIGLHTLCRSSTAALPVVLAPMLWYASGRGRRAAWVTLLATLAFAVVVLPWGIRNAVTLGTPTILSSEGGATLFFGTHPEWGAIWSAPGGEGAFVESERMRSLIGEEYYLSEAADARLRAEGLRQLAERPEPTLLRGALGAARAWLYMPGGITVTRGRPWLWIPVVAVPVSLLALSLESLLRRRDRLLTAVLLGFPGYLTGTLVLASAHPRHVLPVFPLVAVGGGLAVGDRVAAWLARRRARPAHGAPGPGGDGPGARAVADGPKTRQQGDVAGEASRSAAWGGVTRRAGLWAGLFLLTVSVDSGPTSPLQTSAAAGPGDPFGVLFSVGATASPAAIDRMFAEARGVGVGWVRTDFFWDVIEPERGVFRWAVPDRIVQAAGANSIQLLGILDYSAPWASSDPAGLSDKYPPRQVSDFARYVLAMVSRYRGAVSYWEVWNEPDVPGFWRGSAEEYATLLAVSYRVVKAANPESRVVLGGLAQGGDHNPTFLDKVLTFCRERAEPCFDIMAFHTNFRTMRAIRQQFDSNRRILAKHGFDRPIWVTESSYTSDPRYQTLPGYDGGEASQAQYLVDAFSRSLSLGAERIFWAGLYDYDPQDAVASGLAAYAMSGLLGIDGRPKAVHSAYQRLARGTAGAARPGFAAGDGPGFR